MGFRLPKKPNFGKAIKNFGSEAKKIASKYNAKAVIVEAGNNIKQAPIKALAYRNDLKAEYKKGKSGEGKKIFANIIQGGTGINILAGTDSSINAGTQTDIVRDDSFGAYIMSGFGILGKPKVRTITYDKVDNVGSVSSDDKEMWSGQKALKGFASIKNIFKK